LAQVGSKSFYDLFFLSISGFHIAPWISSSSNSTAHHNRLILALLHRACTILPWALLQLATKADHHRASTIPPWGLLHQATKAVHHRACTILPWANLHRRATQEVHR